jgi:hypothetical protein
VIDSEDGAAPPGQYAVSEVTLRLAIGARSDPELAPRTHDRCARHATPGDPDCVMLE